MKGRPTVAQKQQRLNMHDDQNPHLGRPRAVEFFAGIGGFATACPGYQVVAAYDVNQLAARVYQANHPAEYLVREIESLPLEELAGWNANLWWMSPPCQPYTHRGKIRDTQDARSRSLMKLIDALAECLPAQLAVENVCGFANSQAHARLVAQLEHCGYHWQQRELCPTQLGWPNRRPRFYLLARRSTPFGGWHPLPSQTVDLRDLIDVEISRDPALHVNAAFIQRYEQAIDRIDGHSQRPTACFASSYGQSPLNSGSYLATEDGYRRLHPREVANLLGYPTNFVLPNELTYRQLWKLLRNSLSLPAVRYIMQHLD